uniref:Uncharacterized protein n=1 Tax=viral metagenome TaxID=1070528 RepID=A0A6M3XTP7_9ZZZZ
MAHTNVRSEWVSGNLVFYDKSNNIIFTIDGTNRSLVMPSGAVFTCASLDLSTTELGLLDGVSSPGDAVASKVLTSDAYKTTRIGEFATAGATTGAVALAATLDHYSDGQVDVFSIFGASTANLTSAKSAKVARFRHIVNCTTAAHETYGAVGQVVVKDTTLTHLHAGVMGTFEGHTSGVVLNSSYSVGHAAVTARIGGHAAITATTPLAGFLAFNNASAALASGSSAAFATSMVSSSYPWTYGLYIPTGSCTTGISITNAPSTLAYTSASATPGTVRTLVGDMTTYSSMSSGNLVGIRGTVTMAGNNTGGYLYGAQGKAITGAYSFAGTVLAGLYGQIDVSGGTITSGHVAAIQANIYGANSGSIPMEGIYIESAGGGVINSFIQCFGKSDYVFDVASNTHVQMSTTGTVGSTASKGWLKVLVEGSVRYIPLADSVS